jgi:hypothetical protein
MAGGYYWCLQGCTLDLLPKEKPEGMDQKLWESRKKVKIKRDQLFKWMNGIWEGRRTMSGYYRQKTCADEPKCCPNLPNCYPPGQSCQGCGCCQRSEETTQSNITHIFDQQNDREDKCPKIRAPYFPPGGGGVPGTYEEGKCDGFNNWPSSRGRRPDSDLIKTSYNVCFENQSTAWHETTYQRRNIGPVSKYCDEPAPDTNWIQYNNNTTDRTLQASTCTSSCCPPPGSNCNCPGPGAQSPICPVKPIRCYYGNCRVRFFSVTSIHIPKTGHWYDPEKGDVYPNIVFSSTYPTVDWEQTGCTQGSKEGFYQKHSTKVTITVDGVVIPSGSTWGRMGYMGNLTVADTWTWEEREK